MCLRQLLQSSQLQRAWRAAFLKHVQGGPYRCSAVVVVTNGTTILLTLLLLRVVWGVVLTGFLCFCLGQASSATVKQTGKLTEFMCNLAWDFPIKEGFQVFKEMLATKPLMGSHHSWSRPQSLLSTPGMRSYVTSTDSSPAHASKGALIFSPEGLPPRVRELYQRLKEFMERHVYPAELELQRHQVSAERWTPSPLVEDLKEKAKAEGLWNLFLPLETDPEKKYGAGLTNVEYAHLCEVMGTSLYAPEIFNCSAPDTGNMELLVRYGTEEQKARWLIPLLEGKARSCFAMTEPQVASSDATNIESSIREEDGFYVINGHKWWITGILDPRCQLCVFMGKTDPHAPRHQQQSMFLVPMDTPGIKIIRPLRVYGLEDAPGLCVCLFSVWVWI
uniref:Acyl-CoA dehydrogenase family member 10 n=1 Tax=Bos mutus grunniens TaxID=30521 RepID=A0A8B9XPA7_BOSMU